MYRFLIIFLGFVLIHATTLQAETEISPTKQTSEKKIGIGLESQFYPAGFIHGIRFDYFLSSVDLVNVRSGYNFARRLDYGKHDNEEGGGIGFGLGYRRTDVNIFGETLFLGARLDFWNMNINWQRDFLGLTQNGISKIKVLQPTLELGKKILLDDNFTLTLSIALGMEVNYKTIGEPVGEGAILLWGVSLGYEM